jgi:hypothetical protein
MVPGASAPNGAEEEGEEEEVGEVGEVEEVVVVVVMVAEERVEVEIEEAAEDE